MSFEPAWIVAQLVEPVGVRREIECRDDGVNVAGCPAAEVGALIDDGGELAAVVALEADAEDH